MGAGALLTRAIRPHLGSDFRLGGAVRPCMGANALLAGALSFHLGSDSCMGCALRPRHGCNYIASRYIELSFSLDPASKANDL